MNFDIYLCTMNSIITVSPASSSCLDWNSVAKDCNVYVLELNSVKEAATLKLHPGRQGYLLCAEGSVMLDALGEQHELRPHDAAELRGPLTLTPSVKGEAAFLLLFEMSDGDEMQEI